MRKKTTIFCFSEFWFLSPFRPFSSIFFFILCNSSVHATSHIDPTYKLDFWHRELWHHYVGLLMIFEKCTILTLFLLGAILFSKKALKAKRHNCGYRDIISWYAVSMWQRNVRYNIMIENFSIFISKNGFKRSKRGPRAKIHNFGYI